MIKFIKLTNGDDIVGYVTEQEHGYFIQWPVRVYYATEKDPEDENLSPKSKVAPYLPHVKGHSVVIRKSLVMFIAEPVVELKEYYEKTFGNLVAVADQPPTLLNEEVEDETLIVDTVNGINIIKDGE